VDVLRWVSAHATTDLNSNGKITMGGISAGGQISAVLSHVARDEGLPVIGALLTVPVSDASVLDDDWKVAHPLKYKSWKTNENCPWLDYNRMSFFYKNFIPKGYDKTDPYLSVVYSKNFKGLCPSMVVVAEVDVLADEADAYAKLLRENGVDVTYRYIPGVAHHFEHLYACEPKARQYRDESIAWLKCRYNAA